MRKERTSRQAGRPEARAPEEQEDRERIAQGPDAPALQTLLPGHPTGDGLRRQSMLRLQRVGGNARLARAIGVRPSPARADEEAAGLDYIDAYHAAKARGEAPFAQARATFQGRRPPALLSLMRDRLGEADGGARARESPAAQIQRMDYGGGRREGVPDPSELPGNDEMVTEVLTFFYPDNPPGQLNDPLRDLAARMLWRAIEGSEMMDLVPRPTGTRPGFSWLIKQAVKIAWRRGRAKGIYEAVRRTVALAHRSEYELAREGIGL